MVAIDYPIVMMYANEKIPTLFFCRIYHISVLISDTFDSIIFLRFFIFFRMIFVKVFFLFLLFFVFLGLEIFILLVILNSCFKIPFILSAIAFS